MIDEEYINSVIEECNRDIEYYTDKLKGIERKKKVYQQVLEKRSDLENLESDNQNER